MQRLLRGPHDRRVDLPVGRSRLVATEEVERFCSDVEARYVAPLDQPAVAPLRLYPTPPSAGAAIIRP